MAAGTIRQLPSCGPAASTKEEDACKKRRVSRSKDLLWKEFFRDPSQWWDNRNTKSSPRYPDFKHKGTREPLWADSWDTPSWVPDQLLSRGFAPSAPLPQSQTEAFVASLRACTKHKDLTRGTRIHDDLLHNGLLVQCSDALVTMYAKCGELAKAKALLDIHNSSDAITWTALIAGYAREGQGQNALDCFERMRRQGILADAVTYSCILKACATIGTVEKGKQIHEEIARQGLLQNNIVLGGALVDMYAKCGTLSMAQHVLETLPSRNVVSWNALITGYAQEGQAGQVLNCFEQMQHDGILPDDVTYICILKACTSIGALDKGKEIHDEILRQGLLQKNILLGGALVDMYAKCGALSMAQRVLEGLPSRNVVSWSALIAGYAQDGQAEQALNCFAQMQRECILPDAVTYAFILKACAAIGAMDKGKEIHDEIARQGLQNNIVLGGALVDMYAKCGALSIAQCVLEGLPSRNVVSWSALIAGYAQKGQAENALSCFEQMQREGILPDAVTFSSVLNVCSHLGLVEEGQAIFMNMSTKYNVKPDLECYTCIVDLLGRAGHLEKAARLIQEMPPSDYSSVIWLALLSACQKWGDVDVGSWAFERAVQLDKSDGPAYILMANIYAAAGMQEKSRNIEAVRMRNSAWKKPRHSCWVDASNFGHVLSVEDTIHAQSKCIHAKPEDIAYEKSWRGYSQGLHCVP